MDSVHTGDFSYKWGICRRAVVEANESLHAHLCLLSPISEKVSGAGEVAEESHQSTLLPAQSHCWEKQKLVVALTSMTWEGPLSENTIEKVHLCKH